MFDRPPRRFSFSRLVTRRTVGIMALAAGACSVYSSELLDEAASNGGRGGGNSGSSSTTGGTPNNGGSGAGDAPATPDAGDSGMGGDPINPEGGAGAGTAGSSGAAAGGTAQGGTSGSSGAGTAGSGGVPVGPFDLLDDFEDKNITVEPLSGRSGFWYLFNDKTTGTATPNPLVTTPQSEAPEELGNFALRTTATGFTSFGSGLGVDFRAEKAVYDASAYAGFRFWAKVGSGKNTKHRVQIADITTDVAGGKCKTGASVPNDEKCDNHFGAPLKLTTTWTSYYFYFADLTQIEGWGQTAESIDKSHVYGLQITAGPDLDVDLWVDQFEFF